MNNYIATGWCALSLVHGHASVLSGSESVSVATLQASAEFRALLCDPGYAPADIDGLH